jgi:hypothetical protein
LVHRVSTVVAGSFTKQTSHKLYMKEQLSYKPHALRLPKRSSFPEKL